MSSNLVNMAHQPTFKHQTGDYRTGQTQRESGFYRSQQDTNAFSFNDATLKLLNDYKQMNKMLMLALGQDINEIERIGGVRSMEEPEQLLSYLHSKGMLSQTELTDLKYIHTQNGAIKNAGTLSGYVATGANLATDQSGYKGYSSGASLPNNAPVNIQQGYSSTYIYTQQTGKEATAAPQRGYAAVQSSFSASSSLQSVEKQLSPSVVSTLRGCETLSSQRFYESLERFVKYRSGVTDEAAIVDFLRSNGFDSSAIRVAENIGTCDKANSLKRQLDELTQMTDNHRREYISQLENTVKIHPVTSHYLSKLSPEKSFNGKNLDDVLANVERKLEMISTKNSSYEKVINDLEKKLLESNLKTTTETENANRVLSMAKSKELRSQELASFVRKICALHHHQCTEDYSSEIQAIKNLDDEINGLRHRERSSTGAIAQQSDAKLFQGEIQGLQSRVSSLTTTVSTLKASYQTLQNENEESGNLILTLKSKVSELEGALQTRKSNEKATSADLQKQVESYETKIRNCTVELETANRSIVELSEFKESMTEQIERVKELDSGFRNLQARERQLSIQFGQLQAREQQAESLEQSIKTQMDQFVNQQKKLEAREYEVETMISSVQTQRAELEAHHRNTQSREQQLESLQKSIRPKLEELATKERQLEDYRIRLEAFNSENLQKKGELDAKLSEWETQVKNAQAKGQEADIITQQFTKLSEDAKKANNELNVITNEKNIIDQENRSLRRDLKLLNEEKTRIETQLIELRTEHQTQIETLETVKISLKEEKRSHEAVEAQFKSLQTAFYSLHQNYDSVCDNYSTAKVENETITPKLNIASEENDKLRELINMLETQTSKMETAHQEELQKTSQTISKYIQHNQEIEAVAKQRDSYEKEIENLRSELLTAKSASQQSQAIDQQPVSKIAAASFNEQPEVSGEEFEGLKEENSKLREDLESLMDQIKHAQEILDENEELKDRLGNMQQDNELMAQALEEINDKIEKRQIIIVDNEGEEEGREENNGSQDDQVRIDDKNLQRIANGEQAEGEEEGVEGLDEMGPAELLQYTTDELKKLKDAYDQMKDEYEHNLEEMDVLRRENDELKYDLIKIVGAHEEALGEEMMDGQEEGYENQEATGEEEQDYAEENDERTNDEIIDENDQLIELLKQLSQQISALKEAYLEVINDLFNRNEQREAKGLNYTEFVNSAEEMQEQVKQSQHERGLDNMRDFNKGLRESVEFYETEKLRMIARIQKIEHWCREDEQGLEEGTDREAAEEGQEEAGDEEQYQDGMAEQYQGEEEMRGENENEELSVDKLVELLLITLQLIEKIRETAATEEASESDRLISIVESINKFEQMGDSGEGNFELATILQKIVENKISQDGVEEYANAGEEEQGMEEQDAGEQEYGQEERVAFNLLQDGQEEEEEEIDYETLKDNFGKVCQLLEEKEHQVYSNYYRICI